MWRIFRFSIMTHRWAYLPIQHVAITWSISLRKFLITRVIQRNRHPCRSMWNGSTMMTHIIHRSLGRISGSVTHSMYTWGTITCRVLFPGILRDQPLRFEFKRYIFWRFFGLIFALTRDFYGFLVRKNLTQLRLTLVQQNDSAFVHTPLFLSFSKSPKPLRNSFVYTCTFVFIAHSFDFRFPLSFMLLII